MNTADERVWEQSDTPTGVYPTLDDYTEALAEVRRRAQAFAAGETPQTVVSVRVPADWQPRSEEPPVPPTAAKRARRMVDDGKASFGSSTSRVHYDPRRCTCASGGRRVGYCPRHGDMP